jgi:hypothetical protein
MTLTKEPFRLYNTDKKEKADIISVRISKEERETLEELKEILDINSDAKALKFSAFIGRNVVFSIFGRKMATFLFKEDRLRYSGKRKFLD